MKGKWFHFFISSWVKPFHLLSINSQIDNKCLQSSIIDLTLLACVLDMRISKHIQYVLLLRLNIQRSLHDAHYIH